MLSAIHVPTLVMHRSGDRDVPIEAGRDVADRIAGATFVELPGIDSFPWAGDQDPLLAATEAFVTGARATAEPDRVLATVLFTDIVGSTEKAAALGDARWKELLAAHDERAKAEIDRFRGRYVNTTGDGFLATFDGPARGVDARERSRPTWRRSGSRSGQDSTQARSPSGVTTSAGSPSRSAHA